MHERVDSNTHTGSAAGRDGDVACVGCRPHRTKALLFVLEGNLLARTYVLCDSKTGRYHGWIVKHFAYAVRSSDTYGFRRLLSSMSWTGWKPQGDGAVALLAAVKVYCQPAPER